MKKRILSVIMIFALVFTGVFLTSCSEKETPEQIFKKAYNNTKKLDAFDTDVSLEMSMNVQGITMSFPVKGNFKAKNLNDENLEFYLDGDATFMGQKMDLEAYYADGWIYLSSMGTSSKIALDYAEFLKSAKEESRPEMDVYEGAEYIEEDGEVVAKCDIPAKTINDYIKEYVESTPNSEALKDGSVKFNKISAEVSTKDNYLNKATINFGMKVDVEGQSGKVDLKITINFKNAGKPVEITPMEGYENFEDSSDLLGSMIENEESVVTDDGGNYLAYPEDDLNMDDFDYGDIDVNLDDLELEF